MSLELVAGAVVPDDDAAVVAAGLAAAGLEPHVHLAGDAVAGVVGGEVGVAVGEAAHLELGVADGDDDDDTTEAVEGALEQQRDVEHDGPVAAQVAAEYGLVYLAPHGRVHDAVEHAAVPLALLAVAEDAPPQRRAVQRPALAVDATLRQRRRGGLEQVRRRRAEVLHDGIVAAGARLDDLTRQDVGVDDGQRVRRGRKDGRHGGLAGRNGAG